MKKLTFVSRFGLLAIALLLVVGGFFVVQKVFATVGVTPATGGTNISVDKAANGVSPTYTTLDNIVISEGTDADFAASQTNATLILTAPTGWQFNAGIGSVSAANGRDVAANGPNAISIAVSASTITVTLTTDKSANKSDIITISDIQVQAIDANLVPSIGNILRTSGNPGTASVAGIVNDSTNFGSLSQFAKTNPTLSVTNSPVIYNRSGQTATVTGSVPGVVSNILVGGATLQTNAGTYAVTADFTPTDTTNYNSLIGAPAGNFVINKADPVLYVNNSPVTYDGNPHSAVVTVQGLVGGIASNILTGGASSQTEVGTYAVTANWTTNDPANYNHLMGASAGNFVIEPSQ